jgi:iron complex transport system substrate-binding protein
MKRLCAWLLFCIALPACSARTVRDQLGRTVQVPEHPHRLVCLMPSVVDDVYALGAGADVIAVTDYTKYPAEARTKPSVGSILSPSMETILSLHPDLVLGSADMSNTETLQQLEQLGIATFMVSTHGVEGIYQSIASLGLALNREDSARELIAGLRGREAAVRRRVSGKPVVSILMPVGYDPIVTIGKHAFITELIEIAGGHSVTGDIDQE